jgi:hypothetical protein
MATVTRAIGKWAAWRNEHPRRLNRFLPIVLVLGLLGGGLGATLGSLPASASVGSVTFAGSSYVANTPGTTWTVDFTSTSAESDSNHITVTFAAGFVAVASPTVTLGTGFSDCAVFSASGGSNVVTIVLENSGGTCAYGSGHGASSLSILGITNPAAAVYPNTDFSVLVGGQTVAYSGSDVTITGTASAVTFTGSTYVALTPGTTWSIGFTTSTAETESDHITVSFAAGFIAVAAPSVSLVSGFHDCAVASASGGSNIVTIVLENSGGTCTFGSGATATLNITGITNPTAGTYPNTDFSVGLTGQGAVSPAAAVVITGTSAVTFTGSTYAAFATGTTWTIGFTSAAFEGSGDTIVVTFAPGFVSVAHPSVVLGAGFTDCAVSSDSGGANVVTILLTGVGCQFGGGAPSTLSITGITNPTAGTYPNVDFSVATTTQGASSPIANVVITGTSAVTFTGSTYAAFATGTTWTIGFTSAAVEGSGDTIVVTFAPGFVSVVNPTVTLGAGFTDCTVSSTSGGGSVVTIYLAGISCSFGGGVPSTLSITGITNPTAATYPNTDFSVATTTQGASSPATNVVITGSSTIPNQIYGIDAIGTAIAISQQEFPASDSAQGVVLCRSDFFSDCLVGGPLAADINGPLLITPGAALSNAIDPRVDAEIERVLPVGGTVYILGGNLALSPNIDATLGGQGYNVIREAGVNEYATAVDVAQAEGNPSTIFEATGLSFYDALSSVPAAIKAHAAILLTEGSRESLETFAYLLSEPGDTRYTIGGSLAAGGADPSAFNVSGGDLFATSAAVAATFFPGASMFGVATWADFADALGGGVFMATGGRSGPLLLVNPSAPLPFEILPYLASLAPGTQAFVFGGPLAVGPDVLAALQSAIG